MAQRRMFSKSITNSSQFLMMPQSSQNLYFHLGMNADDDGFCEHFSLMRMTDSKPDDLKILQAKGFVTVFDDKVLVISDWKENNYLRADRYSPSKYLDIYKDELHRLSSGIPMVDTGKDRIGEVRKGKETTRAKNKFSQEGAEVLSFFESWNPACKSYYKNTTQRKACENLIEIHGIDRLRSLIIETLPKTNTLAYMPTITTPLQLLEKYSALEAAVNKYKNKITSAQPKGRGIA